MAATDSDQTTTRIGKTTMRTRADGIEFERLLDAPRHLVWEAMTKAEHFTHWWGPASQEMISAQLDFRVGGSYRFVTRGDDGIEHAFRGEIREIVPLEHVVQTFEYEGMPGAVTLDSLTLIEQGNKTLLKSTSIIESGTPEAVEAMVASGMAEGAAETYDRLEAYALTLA
jgi:uncharacterized protein YndB with AHSA1/START domain